jgi:hypothetical protein
MGFETKRAGAAIRLTRDRRAPKSHRHRSWIERLLSSAFRTVVEGFALYGPHMRARCIRGPSFRRTTSLASPVSAKFARWQQSGLGKRRQPNAERHRNSR